MVGIASCCRGTVVVNKCPGRKAVGSRMHINNAKYIMAAAEGQEGCHGRNDQRIEGDTQGRKPGTGERREKLGRERQGRRASTGRLTSEGQCHARWVVGR